MKTATRQQASGDSQKFKVAGYLFCALVFSLCSSVEAQPATQIPKIGYMTAGGSFSDPGFVAFRQGLQELGYTDGKNASIESRSAEANVNRIPALVAELIQLKVDVLVSSSQPGTRAAKEATKTIPIIMVASFDPIATRIIDSLARPGGNITGVARLQRELGGKRLELLQETVPRISRVGVLWNQDTPGPHQAFKEYEAAAPAFKIQLQSLEVRSPNPDFEGAFRNAAGSAPMLSLPREIPSSIVI